MIFNKVMFATRSMAIGQWQFHLHYRRHKSLWINATFPAFSACIKLFNILLMSLSLIKYDIALLSLYNVSFYWLFFATQVTLNATNINIKLKALSHTEQKLMDRQLRNSGSFLVAVPTTTVTIECPFISLKPPVLKDLWHIPILKRQLTTLSKFMGLGVLVLTGSCDRGQQLTTDHRKQWGR